MVKYRCDQCHAQSAVRVKEYARGRGFWSRLFGSPDAVYTLCRNCILDLT